MHERLLSREDVIKAFGVKEFQKGLAYLMGGNIVSAIETNGTLRGAVQGTMDRPYEVRIDLDDLDGAECSCPVDSMCKHCAALAIAYADGKVTHLKDIEEYVAKLTEDEAKAMLIKAASYNSDVALDVMIGAGSYTWLSTRKMAVAKALNWCDDVEDLHDGCETMSELIKGAICSDAPPDEAMQFCFAVASEALDALDRAQGDPYEDLEGLVLFTMELFGEAVGALPEDHLEDSLDSAMALFGRDWKGIALENMPLAFSSRLGAERIIERFNDEQVRNGPVARGIRRIGSRYLAYCAQMIAGDIDAAVGALLSDGASEDDTMLAADTYALRNEWGKARRVLESGVWTRRKRERARLLLLSYINQGPEADIPPARSILRLLRSIDIDHDKELIGKILMLLQRTESDDSLALMIGREKIGAMTKVQLLAEMGRWDEVEREIGKVRVWDQNDIWDLATKASSRPDISTRLAILALSGPVSYISFDHKATVAAALRNMSEEDLAVLEGKDVVAMGIDTLISSELAPRFPEKAMGFLKEGLAELDPQRLADVMSALTDRRMASDLGHAWIRRKLTVGPRYDTIRSVLTVMRCMLPEDDWRSIRASLLKEFAGRAALRDAFDDVERTSEFEGKVPPMVRDDVRPPRKRPSRSWDQR